MSFRASHGRGAIAAGQSRSMEANQSVVALGAFPRTFIPSVPIGVSSQPIDMHWVGVRTRQAFSVGIAASVVFLLARRANAHQRQLEDAEQTDSGRGLELVSFDVAGGAQFVSVEALSANNVYIAGEPLNTSSFGPSFSAGAGLRLHFLTVGPRFRFGTFSDWDLWTLNLDLGWHVPLGKLEPYIFAGGGFAKLAHHASSDSAATGFDVRLGGGLDYYVSNVFSVGGRVDVDLLSLSHSIVFNAPRIPLTHSWSSLGFVVTPGVVAGVHFY